VEQRVRPLPRIGQRHRRTGVQIGCRRSMPARPTSRSTATSSMTAAVRLQDQRLRQDLDHIAAVFRRTSARVVREDPNLRGFLVLGTDAARGTRATAARAGSRSRRSSHRAVYDVQFIKRSHDLVIATHGRGLFVMDNITPLESSRPTWSPPISTCSRRCRPRSAYARGAPALPHALHDAECPRRRGDRLPPQGCRRHRLIRLVSEESGALPRGARDRRVTEAARHRRRRFRGSGNRA